MVISGTLLEAAFFDDADEFGAKSSFSRRGEGIANDIVSARFGSEPIPKTCTHPIDVGDQVGDLPAIEPGKEANGEPVLAGENYGILAAYRR